ncbi:MAG: MFS transporter [Gammaproteobacteria bacterium]|nr:MFS transporter [Gammaproteobacteria bacterium]
MLNRNVVSLTLAQSFAMTGPAISVLLGGIVGNALAPSPQWATLPVALMVIGGALTIIPAARLMQAFGRKLAFISAAGVGVSAGLIAAYGINNEIFAVFCLACLLIGVNNAFVQQYRFAAAESVPSESASKAISFMMLGGIVAAYIGPEVATLLVNSLGNHLYTGSFIGLSILMVGAILSLLFYQNTQPSELAKVESLPARKTGVLVRQPLFITAVAASTVASGMMGLIMTVTPVSMHVHSGFSVEDTATVIQSHIIAMFLPSLISGYLVARFGVFRMMIAGALSMAACIGFALWDSHFLNYWTALILLGVGWNFLFISGTTALTQTHRDSEKYTAQAINDTCIFGFQALTALSAGAIMGAFGWSVVQWACLPFILILMVGVAYTSRIKPVPITEFKIE